MLNKLFKKEDEVKGKRKPDKIDIDSLIQPPEVRTEKIFLYNTIDFEDISIRDRE
ncbi:MAG: hypothetical protein ACRENO_07890 [Thermodesulfobacteriota bacterium]